MCPPPPGPGRPFLHVKLQVDILQIKPRPIAPLGFYFSLVPVPAPSSSPLSFPWVFLGAGRGEVIFSVFSVSRGECVPSGFPECSAPLSSSSAPVRGSFLPRRTRFDLTSACHADWHLSARAADAAGRASERPLNSAIHGSRARGGPAHADGIQRRHSSDSSRGF